MSQKPTTPDLVERWRETNEAFVRRDFDAMMSFFAPDAVWDLSSAGIGRFEGTAAIRGFHEDWIGPYGEYENRLEVQDLGNDVSFVVLSLNARPADSAGTVQERWGFTVTWAAGMIVRVIGSTDIDEARAATERLAEERADG
jgi:ketosteroid isomerase-like protein